MARVELKGIKVSSRGKWQLEGVNIQYHKGRKDSYGGNMEIKWIHRRYAIQLSLATCSY